jgi:hypothetical protein
MELNLNNTADVNAHYNNCHTPLVPPSF